jgi:hypothetical protein
MPTPRRRRPNPHQRRAITLLAGCGDAGCTEAVIRERGFTAEQLAELVRHGFITKTSERVVGTEEPSLARFKLAANTRSAISDEGFILNRAAASRKDSVSFYSRARVAEDRWCRANLFVALGSSDTDGAATRFRTIQI